MNTLLLGYQICLRSWQKLFSRPVHLIFSFIQPIFWLTIFGFLFERNFQLTEGSYLSYLLPGVCAMTILLSSSQAGLLFIKDFQTDFFYRYHYTPASKFWFIFFKLLADYGRIVFQLMILILIGFLIEVENIYLSFSGIFKILLITFLFTFFYGSISSYIALKTRVSELMATFIQLFNMPLIFTSTALVPNKNLPNWLSAIAAYNPLSFLSDSIRADLISTPFKNVSFLHNSFILLCPSFITFVITYLYYKQLKLKS